MANPQFDNRNSGALFSNDKRRTENSPNHTGQVEIVCPSCGVSSEFWLSAWVKQMKNSTKRFFSLAFTAKDVAKAYNTRTSAPSGPEPVDDFDDDIPF